MLLILFFFFLQVSAGESHKTIHLQIFLCFSRGLFEIATLYFELISIKYGSSIFRMMFKLQSNLLIH